VVEDERRAFDRLFLLIVLLHPVGGGRGARNTRPPHSTLAPSFSCSDRARLAARYITENGDGRLRVTQWGRRMSSFLPGAPAPTSGRKKMERTSIEKRLRWRTTTTTLVVVRITPLLLPHRWRLNVYRRRRRFKIVTMVVRVLRVHTHGYVRTPLPAAAIMNDRGPRPPERLMIDA